MPSRLSPATRPDLTLELRSSKGGLSLTHRSRFTFDHPLRSEIYILARVFSRWSHEATRQLNRGILAKLLVSAARVLQAGQVGFSILSSRTSEIKLA